MGEVSYLPCPDEGLLVFYQESDRPWNLGSFTIYQRKYQNAMLALSYPIHAFRFRGSTNRPPPPISQSLEPFGRRFSFPLPWLHVATSQKLPSLLSHSLSAWMQENTASISTDSLYKCINKRGSKCIHAPSPWSLKMVLKSQGFLRICLKN